MPRAYSAVLHGGKTVGYYADMLPPDGVEQDYMSVSIPADAPDWSGWLHRHGFLFTDRTVTFEIPLQKFRPAMDPGKRFTFVVDGDWPAKAVFTVARESFDRDRRFALDMAQEDTDLKDELLEAHITDLSGRQVTATCLFEEERLEGFTLWQQQEKSAEILLGAMSVRYRGTGLALALYSHTVCDMRERGADRLCEVVATSNAASLNLHAMLIRCAGGAFRFGGCRDYFRRERFPRIKENRK